MTNHDCRVIPGLCHSCKQQARPGKTRCVPCAEKERERGRIYRAKHPDIARASWTKYRTDHREEHRSAVRRWRKANEAKVGRKRLKERYGIEEEHVAAVEQARHTGVCMICNKPAQACYQGILHIDHNHSTGKVRGLLCGACNRGLGSFGDSAALLRAAADYLDVRS